MLQKIGKKIKDERKFQNMTQSDLARFSGVSRSTISKIENAHISHLSLHSLIAILEVLSLELSVRAKSDMPTLDSMTGKLVVKS